MTNLSGKKVILLGGSSGIGLATAIAAAAEGVQVTIVSSNQQRLDEALKHLPKGTSAYCVDLSLPQNIKEFFKIVGRFDHLVYTAGENISLGSIDATDIAGAREFFTIRYWGAFAAVKYGAPLINEGGSINPTSGIASTRPVKTGPSHPVSAERWKASSGASPSN